MIEVEILSGEPFEGSQELSNYGVHFSNPKFINPCTMEEAFESVYRSLFDNYDKLTLSDEEVQGLKDGSAEILFQVAGVNTIIKVQEIS